VSSTFSRLRALHPAIRYRGYSTARSGSLVEVMFHITLDPGLEFSPTLTFAAPDVSDDALLPYLHQIGMVELISYWKAACPQKVVIETHSLIDEQAEWWHDLFIHGLGEFFFQNDIDPSSPDLLLIESHGESLPRRSRNSIGERSSGELVLAAGGKDSSLTLELLKSFDASVRREVMMLNPTRSSLASAQIAGYHNPIVVRRTIDPNLIALNKRGYLNGHTPFSAYLAFLSTMIADIHGLGSVIVSNERSASEENTIFHGLAVNHQYSKGIRFERRVRNYMAQELPGSATYYSLIRPLYDLQVSALFAQHAASHLTSFRSCNVGQREDRWCCRCPKCAFVGITLAPFVSVGQHVEIFGEEFFETGEIVAALEELTGLRDHKPFECVGTLRESRDAVVLTLNRYRQTKQSPPRALVDIAERLESNALLPSLGEARATLQEWGEDHELPPSYAERLERLVQGLV